MFAFSPPKSYGASHPTPAPKAGELPSKPDAMPQIPTPLNQVQPETVGLMPNPKV